MTKKDVSHKTFYIFVRIWKVFARIDIELAAISMKSIEKYKQIRKKIQILEE